jgi:DNA-binding NarL/FixJ family response regulator
MTTQNSPSMHSTHTAPADSLRLVIADDHPLLRRGLREEIEENTSWLVVAEARDGQEALDLIARHQPPLAILDIDMPRLDGFKVAQTVMAEQWPVKLIFLTVHREERFVHKALEAGVLGYVLKDSVSTDIVACIEAVSAGQLYASPTLAGYLLKRRRPATRKQGLEHLTPSERLVLKFIANYQTTKDIAETLNISKRTVESHRANICQKLDLRGSHALMKFALAHQAELED